MPPSLFADGSQWQIMMFWYGVLTSVCGGLLLLSVVKSGYDYSRSALNPGIRVSFIEDVQRMVLAMGMIALAPLVVSLLLGINNGLAELCGRTLEKIVVVQQEFPKLTVDSANMFETILASGIRVINFLFNIAFGLQSLDDLIFNGSSGGVFSHVFKPINTDNVFADALIELFLALFNVYFNAVYAIRKWMIAASIVASPLVIWVWALSGERAVLEVYFGEIIQAVFMQSSHALSLGIFMSIATGTAAPAIGTDVGNGLFASHLVTIGVFFAGLAGSICAAVLVVLGIRMITTTGEKEREKAKEGIRKALVGLFIVGLCTVIASVIATTLSGSWGVRY